MMRALALACALAAAACGAGGGAVDAGSDASGCGDALAECESQCGGTPAQGVCWNDPICGADHHWTCFCRPCASDLAGLDLRMSDLASSD